MPRFKLVIEYDGTGLVGWQRQGQGLSVQGLIEDAIFAFSGTRPTVFTAGRTDAGVHATAQVAHCDLDRDMRGDKLRDAINFHLKPHRVAIIGAERAADDFHARFSARGRRYRYDILNRRARPALLESRVWWVPVALDAEAMAEGAAHLIGAHDFTSFRAAECQAKSPLKTLDGLTVTRQGDMITIESWARSFLHHQVRNMVGSLKMVGTGKWHPDRIKAALDARDRAQAGPTAPPQGLYLTGVDYDARP